MSASGQGTFQNLDFENGIVPAGSDGFVDFSSAFPGWTGDTGTQQVIYAFYPAPAIGTAVVTLLATGVLGDVPIAGNYSAILQSGYGPGGPTFNVGVSLAQTGLIPAGTLSLHFLGHDDFRGGAMVLMDGQSLSLVPVQSLNGYEEYAADISQYAGQTVELRFVRPYISGGANFLLDNISFSPTAVVPEPSTWTLLALGSALFWSAARRRK